MGMYKYGTPHSKLIHDFNCKEAKDIVNPLLAEEVRILKGEQEGGRSQMCKLFGNEKEVAVEAEAKGKAEGKAEKQQWN